MYARIYICAVRKNSEEIGDSVVDALKLLLRIPPRRSARLRRASTSPPPVMEFIDDDWDSQPRARVVHSRADAAANSSPHTANPASRSLPHVAACAAAAVLLLAAAYSLDSAYQVFASILVWIDLH